MMICEEVLLIPTKFNFRLDLKISEIILFIKNNLITTRAAELKFYKKRAPNIFEAVADSRSINLSIVIKFI